MSASTHRAVVFAIRPGVLVRYLCLLIGLFGVLSCIPLAVALASGGGASVLTQAVVVGAALLLGGVGVFATRRRNIHLQRNESLALVALVFVVLPLMQTIPVMSHGIPFMDAWFEAVSGVTTTGLSTLGTVEDKPVSFLFARGWMQWVGGLGIVVLALALVLQPGIVTRKLGFDSREVEDVVGGTRAHARRILIAYVVLTTMIGLALLAAGSGATDAWVHAMAAISTGGFANHDDSLAGVATLERGIVLAGCLAGAVSFHLYYRRQFSSWGRVFGDVQFLLLLALVAVVTALLFAALSRDPALSPLARGEQALWMALSAQTTAGFATMPPQEMGPVALAVLSLAMLVGGGLGSTAGGIKVLRLMIVLRVVQLYLQRLSASAHARIPDRFLGTPLTSGDIQGVVAVCNVYAATLLVSWLIFVHCGHDPLRSLFEVSSALATAGLSAGITGPQLETGLKLVLIVNMTVGRVEALAVVVLLMPRNWLGKRRRVT